jgi:hypothetical protein
MNYPPASPLPPMSAPLPPPPPPPRKSSALKWVLIGCGITGGLGILVCGGCITFGILALNKVMNEAVAKVRPIIAQNETVKAEIGEVKELNWKWKGFKSVKRNGHDSIRCTIEVTGSKGSGSVLMFLEESPTGKEEFFTTLTFVNANGKQTPLGSFRIHDDGQGDFKFTPVDPDSGEKVPVPPEDF